MPGPDDDARLRDHRPPRRLPRPADVVLAPAPRHRHALPVGRRLRRPARGDAAGPARRGALVRRRPCYVFHVGNAHRTPRAGSCWTPPATPPPTPWRCGTAWAATPPVPPRPRPPRRRAAAPLGARPGDRHRDGDSRWRTGRVEFPTVDDERVGRDAATGTRSPTRRRRRHRQVRRGDGRGHRATRSARRPSPARPCSSRCRGRPRGGRRLAALHRHPARRQRVAAAGAGRHRRRRATGGGRDAAARGAVGLPRVVDRGRRARDAGLADGLAGTTSGSGDDRPRARRRGEDHRPDAGQEPPHEAEHHFSPRLMVRGLAWDVGLPLVAYYALHFLGASDWVALLTASSRRGAADRLGRRPRPAAQPVRRGHARGLRRRAGAGVRRR